MSQQMTTQPTQAAAPTESVDHDEGERKSALAASWAMAAGFWTRKRRLASWLLAGAIVLNLAATLGINYGYNLWNRIFFDALEAKNAQAMWQSLMWLPALILIGAGLAALMIWLKQTLQLRWRSYITQQLLRGWLGNQRYYRMSIGGGDVSNVEHRIAEDVRTGIEAIVELAVGLLWSVTNALMFLGVLLFVGGAITVGNVSIPGYIAIAAAAYALLTSGGVAFIGRRLSDAIGNKNEQEAQFRYDLTRIRENAESIAFLRGDRRELGAISESFAQLRSRWRYLIRQNCNITWVTNSNLLLAPVVPALLASPKYVSGELTLGAVMQIVAAFVAVLGALNWLTDNFQRIAELRAATRRTGEFIISLRQIEASSKAPDDVPASSAYDVELQNITLRKSDGTVLIDNANLVVMPGERILIEGKSGSGKSTLLRSLAGLWPWAEGATRFAPGSKVAFVPQRPYLPIGKLIDVLTYPDDRELSIADAGDLLEKVGLAHLVDKLEDTATWDQILSGGERQRIGFARIILDAPDIIVLDEATSALDDEGQAQLFQLLVDVLPNATILNVAHRQGLQQFHDRRVVVTPEEASPIRSEPTNAGRIRSLMTIFKRRTQPSPPSDRLERDRI